MWKALDWKQGSQQAACSPAQSKGMAGGVFIPPRARKYTFYARSKRPKWRAKLERNGYGGLSVRWGENTRRRLSPRAGSCDGWAKEMVEKPDVDEDLVCLDDVSFVDWI
ncbi:MAG: hypothetical protein ACYDH1_01600 [Anaerolineaceae bacterium]